MGQKEDDQRLHNNGEASLSKNRSLCAKIDEVGLLSFVSFGWIFQYLWGAYRGNVDSGSQTCSIFESAGLNLTRMERLWETELRRNPAGPSLFRVTIKFMKPRLTVACLIFLFCLAFGFIGPTCLVKGLISFTEGVAGDADKSVDYVRGSFYVFAILIVEISRVMLYGATWAVSYRTGIRVRSALLTLLYKRLMEAKSMRGKTPAEVVNLFANDGQRIFDAVTFAPLVIVGPFVLVGGLVYLLRVIGALSLLGILVFFVFDILQAVLGIVMVKCRNAAIKSTEKRLSLMGEILRCIRTIKVNVWEDLFIDRVNEIRREEKKNLKMAGYAQSIAIASLCVVPVVATFVTVLSVVWYGSDLLASDAFSAITVFYVMLFGMRMIPYGMRYLAEARSAIGRIQELLLSEKCEFAAQQPLLQPLPIASPNQKGEVALATASSVIHMEDSSFAWDVPKSHSLAKKEPNPIKLNDTMNGELLPAKPAEEHQSCLKNINLQIRKGELIGVCGRVGAGKSALLHAITGHMYEAGGMMTVAQVTIAYVGQAPFILNTTIRENILFGQAMNPQRYYSAISGSQLTKDLESMAENEMSEVGERGATLSGGQKCRVGIARALYANGDICLLDDIFSSVDKPVADRIFKEGVKGTLANSTVLLVTSNPEYLSQCSRVAYLEEGTLAGMDTHDNLLSMQPSYREFLDAAAKGSNSHFPEHVTTARRKSESGELGPAATQVAPKQGTGLAYEEEDYGLAEISGAVYMDYLRAAGGPLLSALVLSAFVLNVASGIFSTCWLAKWMNDVHGNVGGTYGSSENGANATQHGGAVPRSLAEDPNLSYHIDMYGLSLVLLFVTGLLKAILFVKVSLNAATNLHRRMLSRVLHATTSFFDATPGGRVLNRFSKDIDEIDVKLPFSTEAFLQYMLTCLGFLAVIIWVFPAFLLPCVPLAGVFIIFFLCFRSGIRALKRTENVSRSPLFEHISSTLDGLVTIHCYKQTGRFVDTLKSLLDDNSGAMFMFHSAMRWQAVWLDLLVVAATFIVSVLIVGLASRVTPADAGMALALVLQMSGIFQFAVRSKTELEAKMTAVERVSHYCRSIEQEPDSSDPADLDQCWPLTGAIEFDHVTLCYKGEVVPALDGVSLSVTDGQKIGVVGRTGGGKTSLINALFLLYPLQKGQILVDKRSINEVSLARLRRSMAVIPQDPVLFTGTLRFNIDPEGKHTDEQIWTSLDRVGLRETVADLKGKLDFQVEDSGSNLSSGQRQLVCMARTLLRNAKILVLDEATSSVDLQTDAHLLRAIKDTFADQTVLLITHRLQNVNGLGVVVEMADGHAKITKQPAKIKADK